MIFSGCFLYAFIYLTIVYIFDGQQYIYIEINPSIPFLNFSGWCLCFSLGDWTGCFTDASQQIV